MWNVYTVLAAISSVYIGLRCAKAEFFNDRIPLDNSTGVYYKIEDLSKAVHCTMSKLPRCSVVKLDNVIKKPGGFSFNLLVFNFDTYAIHAYSVVNDQLFDVNPETILNPPGTPNIKDTAYYSSI